MAELVYFYWCDATEFSYMRAGNATGCTPVVSPADENAHLVTLGHVTLGGVAAPVTQDQAGAKVCPDEMVLRSIHFDHVIDSAKFSEIFTKEPAKQVVVPWAGLQNDSNKPRRRFPMQYFNYQPKPVNLSAIGDIRICEAFGFVEPLDGHVSVSGTVGSSRLSFEKMLHSQPPDVFSMVWRKTPPGAYKEDTAGYLETEIHGAAFSARRTDSNSQIPGVLKVEFNANVQFEEAAQ